jgi:uncharacterized protein
MRCAYCYYLPVSVSGGKVMGRETLEAMIRNYLSCCGEVASFVWHGGEPTLAGISFYRDAISFQEKYRRPGQKVWNNLQTNGLLLDEEWCCFLSENSFDVGLSIDGTEAIHDHFRKDAGGRPTYDRIRQSIERLIGHGIRPDLLCTVNSETAKRPLEVYETLRDLGTGWIQFIPVLNRNEDMSIRPESVGIEKYGDFLAAIFNRWIYHDLGKVNIQLFIEMINTIAGGSPALCWLQETCGHVPVIEADGKVYSCDHFVNESHCIGDIKSPIDVLLEKDIQKDFGNGKKTGLTEKCRRCDFLKLCNGGCPKDRILINENGEEGQYYFCESLKTLFRMAAISVRRLIELDRNRVPRQQIMEILLREERLRWAGVGRNDLCPCGSGRKVKNCCWERRP